MLISNERSPCGSRVLHDESNGADPSPAKATERPNLPVGSGDGVEVVILGAGLASMTAAHELSKAGYSCTILEARDQLRGTLLDHSQRRPKREERSPSPVTLI